MFHIECQKNHMQAMVDVKTSSCTPLICQCGSNKLQSYVREISRAYFDACISKGVDLQDQPVAMWLNFLECHL